MVAFDPERASLTATRSFPHLNQRQIWPHYKPGSAHACLRPALNPAESTSNTAWSSNQDLMNGCRMQFFFYEVVARIVAICLCVDCIRKVQSGLVERKITSFLHGSGVFDWVAESLLGWPSQ